MTSRTDDKHTHMPNSQSHVRLQDNVVLLVPKSRDKSRTKATATHASAVQPPASDQTTGLPVRNDDDDDPGPSAA